MRILPLLLFLSASVSSAQPMPVTGEILISVSDASSRLRPGVAADPAGGFAVVWREIEGQDGGISGRRLSAAGVPLGTGFVIEPRDDGRHTTDPKAVCRADGTLVAAWGEAAYLRPGCAKARLLAGTGGEDGDVFDLGACANENGRAPKVALAGLPDGRFSAAWEEGVTMTAAGTDVVVRSFGGPGEPLAEARRVDGGEETAEDGFQTAPAVALDAAGRSVALWYDGNLAELLGRRFDAAGQPLGEPFRIDSGTGFPVETAIAAAPGGRFVAAWSSYENGGTRIVAQIFDAAGRKQGAQVAVSPPDSPSRRHRNPAVALDADGGFVVVWDADRVDAGGTGVLGRLFDRRGKPQGAAFRINTTGPRSQGHPAVAFTRSGRFLVAWDSQKDVSGRGSIVGRLYTTTKAVLP
jgi:hypothetical protein